ncbi:MAG: antitoxin [Gaiellaceae bacterium]
MPRTTLDIDATVLRALKQRQHEEGKSLGQLASELLAVALERDSGPQKRPFQWVSKPMHALVDLEDKEAVYDVLDER